MKEIKLFGKQILSWGESEQTKVGRSVKNALSEHSKYKVDSMSLELMRQVALKEPLILKAIHKKNKDTFRNWFILKNKHDGQPITSKVLNVIKNFEEATNIKHKLYVAGVCANIYGTAFIEVIYQEPKNKKADSPVSLNSRPIGLNVLNSENIIERKYKNDKDKTLYWIYKDKKNHGEEIFIHPDRIIDVAIDRLPFSHFGISKIDILANILKSKMNADIAAGETLAWFSTGMLDMTIQNMNDTQEKAMIELFKQHPHYFVHDQDYTLEVKNPNRIDPKPFYEYFYANIAAALEMPTHILVGESKNITGIEIGITDYYHDIENIQEIIFTPIIRKLYTRLLKSYGYTWRYTIHWNPIFVDEMTEGKILQVRSYSAVNAKNAGIVSIEEARHILNDGVVNLDIKKIPEQPSKGQPVNQPNVEPQPPVKKPTVRNIAVKPLTPISRRMIEEAAKREKKLGEEILKEQEKLFKKKGDK